MGKSVTPTFRVVMKSQGMSQTPYAWPTKYAGRPTAENLRKHVFGFAKSLEIGGVNEHLSKSLGFIPYPSHAVVIRQATGEVVAEWKAAPFQVF